MTHYLDSNLAIYVPVLTWLYRYDGPTKLRLTGGLDVVWGGSAGSPVNVNFVIAKRDSNGTIQAAVDTVLAEPATGTFHTVLDGIEFVCNQNDEVIITARGLSNAPGRNIQLLDSSIQWRLEPMTTRVSNSESSPSPMDFELYQNFPNPFNPETKITYKINGTSHVRLVIYNNLGQQVKMLVERRQNAGTYSISWDGRDESGRVVESGLYYFQLNTEENSIVKKMLFVK